MKAATTRRRGSMIWSSTANIGSQFAADGHEERGESQVLRAFNVEIAREHSSIDYEVLHPIGPGISIQRPEDLS
jgi:hypothetical protein